MPKKPTVFRFWQAVEALTPQKADKPDPSNPRAPVYLIDEQGILFPWESPIHRRKPIGKDKAWRYALQCGLYDSKELAALLEEKIGAHEEVYDDRRDVGRSRLFDLGLDENGYPVPESFALSLACWSAGQILQFDDGIEALEAGGRIDTTGLDEAREDAPLVDSGYSGFDELSRRLVRRLAVEAARLRESGKPPAREWFDGLVKFVASKCFLPDAIIGRTPAYIAKCWQIDRKADAKNGERRDGDKAIQGDDLLNSFFIGDLKLLDKAWQRNDVGKGLVEYMTAVAQPEGRTRVDVRAPDGIEAAYRSLTPDRMPQGRWPADHPLAFSQQLAVNEVWRRLANGAGIFAVNGPPGTGKTTLLRDIVAAVVVDRAAKLAGLKKGRSAFKPKASKKLGDAWVPYYEIMEAIGGSAIVIASANNGAVENVSLELPGMDAVPGRVRGRIDYFADLATRLVHKPAWGLLAARLGNKKNRSEFVETFWWEAPARRLDADGQDGASCAQPQGEGLRHHLMQIQEGKRTPLLPWTEAVKRFKEALRREESIRKSLVEAAVLPGRINAVRQKIKEEKQALKHLRDEAKEQGGLVEVLAAETARLSTECAGLRERLAEIKGVLASHDAARPGFMIWLATFGRSHHEWWNRRRQFEEEEDALRRELAPVERARREAIARHTDAKARLNGVVGQLERKQGALAQAQEDLEALSAQLAAAKESLGGHWPEPGWNDEMREKSSPWMTEDWRLAREDVFLAALALHRAFIESHPAEMLANLNLASDWLQGRRMPEIMARTALDALCLVVPVISTTFASVPRMFADIGREGIGWLLIDEAGQALPQQAAGAIWRAKRAVVVGDPNQLEPVIAVPATVEGALARHYDDVNQRWWPTETSAQRLADQTMDIGTWLPGAEQQKLWVGCPLRVHRRCDDPMFSISNRIAYDGLMVHGKPESENLLPECHWLDVRGKDGEGHWVPEEGEAARGLILKLGREHGLGPVGIFLISPFRDCANRLARMARGLGLDPEKTGTVHTTQGKEADVVILVLGGDPKRPGAKDWAAKKPNLLNVAVSRAKKRLYVIGNAEEWGRRRFFREVATRLPVWGNEREAACNTNSILC